MIARLLVWFRGRRRRDDAPPAICIDNECVVLERAHRNLDEAKRLAAMQRQEAARERAWLMRDLDAKALDRALFKRGKDGS